MAAPVGKRSFHDEDALGEALDWQLLRRIVPYVRPHARPLIVSMLLLPLVALLVVARPRIMKWALDEGIARGDLSIIDRAAVLFLVVVAAEYVLRFLQIYAMQLAGARAMADLRLEVFRFLQRAKLGFFDNQPVGRLVTRVTNDVDALGELFASGALNAIGDFLSLLLIVVMMLLLDWRLAMIALATLPPLAFAANWIRHRARDAFRDIRARTARLNSYMGEQVQGVAVVQAYGREDACQVEFDDENDGYRKANHRAILYDATLDALVEGVSIVCAATLLWFAGFRGARLGAAVVSFGTFVAFLQYLEQFFVPIRDLTARYTLLQSAMAGAERVFALLDTKDIEDAPDPRAEGLEVAPDGDPELAIELAGVEFSYKPGVPALRGVDLHARRGERIAVVGATGAGKSTIASLVLRLYERNGGVIRVHGRDVRAWPRDELRRRFAVVPQDVYLFAGTIATNVAMGDEVPDLARVEQALRRVGALDLFLARPGGLDAPVGERGGGLSTGERQLVAFARALYRDPPILILDEATASVDSDTESRLQQALHAVIEGRTSLVIAHRLSTIRSADRVVVMHRGRVAEMGTHDELLARGGLYARLYRLQFGEQARQST
ncbi:MAG: ABC transporter ATP-binding protein [Deltaproteobacteria bacterium]|nr:ABC transporter ATP-binding protein [Deltaproteobacteria bacterium]